MKKLYFVRLQVKESEPVTLGVFTSLNTAKVYEKCYKYTVADSKTWVESKEF